ncbi:MAG: SDR family oxidoreductase [Caldilineaceae bacterium]|nr:SDR family oxidoreductase [Caldilineaceae bacterium]
MGDFSGQVVMVTGGTGNLGGPVARAFAAAGAKVILVDRNAEKQRERFPDWADSPDHWLAAPVDVTKPDEGAAVVAQVVARFGRLDALVNTIGGYRAGKPVHEMDLATWDFMFELNARSTLVMCQAALLVMLSQGRGKIVNVAARAGLAGSANHAAYSASKAAVIRLTESMAAEVRDQGINVNCVLPGTIDTADNRAAMPKADTRKWVKPESLAEVILFLASGAARDIHGVSLPVYGLG